jgi:hypothetical protein
VATTTLAAAEAVQRRGQATTPDRVDATGQAPQQRAAAAPAGLSTSSLGATRGRAAVPEYATGARFAAGGNLLRGTFADPLPGEMFSMTIRWSCPADVLLDFGDGETHQVRSAARGGRAHIRRADFRSSLGL